MFDPVTKSWSRAANAGGPHSTRYDAGEGREDTWALLVAPLSAVLRGLKGFVCLLIDVFNGRYDR